MSLYIPITVMVVDFQMEIFDSAVHLEEMNKFGETCVIPIRFMVTNRIQNSQRNTIDLKSHVATALVKELPNHVRSNLASNIVYVAEVENIISVKHYTRFLEDLAVCFENIDPRFIAQIAHDVSCMQKIIVLDEASTFQGFVYGL
jgi:hypothetical protein